MRDFNLYEWIAYGAVLVGGICWGLAGLFNVYILTAMLGNLLGRLVYIGVGVAAGYLCYQIYLDKFKKAE